IDIANGTFELLGITLAAIQVGPLPGDVIVMKADLTFQGMQLPEPGSLALIGLGLAGLAALRARRI
ncbi:MAG: PEP-CTERM sorting domain-containing protein, partial [bacterium]